MLPITFVNPSDYELFREDDKFSLDLSSFVPGKILTGTIHHSDGNSQTIEVKHSFNQQQIDWFYAGSALNLIAARQK